MKNINKLYKLLILILLAIFSINNVYADNQTLIESVVEEHKKIINEIPINEITTKMYVTLIDMDKKVIATTNPDITVDDIYYSDSVNEPTKMLTLEDNIYVLLEIPETIDSNLEKGIKDGVYYYLNLPDNIIPNEEHIIGNEKGPKEPITLITNSKAKAVGGIYKTDDGYRFKIKFEDISDQIDVKATYQFSMNIKPTGLNEGVNKVNLDFNLPGKLDTYVNILKEEKPVTPQKPEFDIKVNGVWEKSQDSFTNLADINATWTIDITDNKEEPFNNKTLKLDFPGVCDSEAFINGEPVENCMGSIFTQVRQDNQLPLKIYIDNKETTITRVGDNKWGVSLNKDDLNNGKSPVAEIVLKKLNYNSETESLSCSRDVFREMEIQFSPSAEKPFVSGMETTKIESKNIKIVLDSTTFNVDNTSKFVLNADLYSNTNELEYSTNGILTKEYQNFEVSQGISLTKDNACLNNNDCPNEVSSNLLPSSLSYKIKTKDLVNAGNNYVEIEVAPNYQNEIGAYYYSNNFYKLNQTTLYDALNSIKIDGQYIDFSIISIMPTSYPILTYQQFGKDETYPQLQMLIEQLDIHDKNKYNMTFASKNLYNDTRYFLIVSTDTYHYSSNSAYGGYLNTLLDRTTFKPVKWRIILLNTSGKEVEIEYTNDLGMLDIDANELSKKKDKFITNQVKVSNGENSATAESTFKYNQEKDIFTTNGKYLANNIIEWNLNTDYSIFMRDEMLNKTSGNKWLNYAQIFGRFNNNLKTNYDGVLGQLQEMNFSIDPSDLSTIKAYDYNQKTWVSIQAYPTLDNNSTETSMTSIPGYDIYKSGWHNLYIDGRNLLQGGNIQKTRYLTYFKENNNDYLKNTSETRLNARALNSDIEFLEKRNPHYINSYLRHTTIVPTPKLNKTLVKKDDILNDDNNQFTVQTWTVHADTEIYSDEFDKTYYYNGHLDISDDMSKSKISLVNKKEQEKLKLNSKLGKLNNSSSLYNNEEITVEGVTVGEHTSLLNLDASFTVNNQKYNVSFSKEELDT